MTIRLGNKIISGGGSSGVPGWTGTLQEYNNLTEIDDNMLYYITDDCIGEDNTNYTASLEIGDVGFTALGINEDLNLRRYLNGQVLDMNQFPEFTDKVKRLVSTNSSVTCSEEEWQTTAMLSPNGLCDKFVIDDVNMTIRLPKYPEYFIGGLSDKTGVVGNGKALGFTDGTNTKYTYAARSGNNLWTAQPSFFNSAQGNIGEVVTNSCEFFDGYKYIGISTDPSASGIEAQVNSASEKLRGYYFIQVANGLEQVVDTTREITLNNPFFYGMSQYFEVEPNNVSWLKSEGQWNSAEVYPGMWEWILTNEHKLSTGAYTDYDFVVNENNKTFRLPLLDGSENIVDWERQTEVGYKTEYVTLPCNAYVFYIRNSVTSIEDSGFHYTDENETFVYTFSQALTYTRSGLGLFLEKGWKVKSAYVDTNLHYAPLKGAGSLYFYVGDSVQDPSLINVGRLTHALSLKTDMKQAAHAGMPSGKYIDMTLGASGTTYTAPAEGYFMCGKSSSGNGQYLQISGSSKVTSQYIASANGQAPSTWLPVQKGDIVTINYTVGGSVNVFRFIYANGSSTN